ncbi:MAG TPA: DUF6677 family protein [Vicinamibacteria bacterium]|nr:DUF6677 family protein [Vicinamibacteria bacterium]
MAETRPAAAVPAVLFAWLLPGAGHFYLGRKGKGLLFLIALLALFGLGVAMNARLQLTIGLEDPLAALYSVAQVAMGLPYFVARAAGFEAGRVTAVTFEYGNTFAAVGRRS